MKVVAAFGRGWEVGRDFRTGEGREIVALYIGCFVYRILMCLSLIILVSIISLVNSSHCNFFFSLACSH